MRTPARLICALALLIPAVLPSAWAADRDADFTDAELDRMLAPVALYPDTVLSHVLIAATYPLEIVEAARWSRRHPDLRGEDAVDAVEDQDWDASVKALVAFPELLARMDEDLDWVQDLGDAFLAQEEHVADRVQVLRQRAYDAGHLNSLEHVRVIRERELIYIEPAVTHLVYVPFYDTRVVYGGWWWPAYPPVYWAFPFGYHSAIWYWGVGYRIAPSFYFSSWYWPQRRVVVVNHVHHHHFRSGREVAAHREARQWRHEAAHRRGVAYRNEQVRREHASASSTRPERRGQARVEHRTNASDDRRQGTTSQDRGNARRDEVRQREAARSPRQPEATATARPERRDSERRPVREERVAPAQAEQAERPARRERAPRADDPAAERSDEPRNNRESSRQSNNDSQRAERATQEPQRERATREDRNERRAHPDRQNGNKQRGGGRERGSKRERAER